MLDSLGQLAAWPDWWLPLCGVGRPLISTRLGGQARGYPATRTDVAWFTSGFSGGLQYVRGAFQEVPIRCKGARAHYLYRLYCLGLSDSQSLSQTRSPHSTDLLAPHTPNQIRLRSNHIAASCSEGGIFVRRNGTAFPLIPKASVFAGAGNRRATGSDGYTPRRCIDACRVADWFRRRHWNTRAVLRPEFCTPKPGRHLCSSRKLTIMHGMSGIQLSHLLPAPALKTRPTL